jgi:hypothetical protein
LAALFPAGNKIVTFAHFCQKPRNFRWIILEVCVHGDDQITFGGRKCCCQGASLAKIATMPQANDARVALGRALNRLPGPVTRSIVDEDNLEIYGFLTQHLYDRINEWANIALFIHRRNYHAQGQPPSGQLTR